MNRRMRLGPAAVFLLITAMILVTLAMLTVSTAEADLAMTGRFAAVTQIRYGLRADGERFLCEAAAAGAEGRDLSALEGVIQTEDGYTYIKESGGYRLEASISGFDKDGNYELKNFRISKMWQSADPAADIWKGN